MTETSLAQRRKVWYGDVLNRKCSDCGELCDWDERLRCGYVAVGTPEDAEYQQLHQRNMHNPANPPYDTERRYGNTPEGRAEQAKLEQHANRFHRGGQVSVLKRPDGWRLEIRRYDAGIAASRAFLLKRRPFYGILSTVAPNGQRVCSYIEGCRTPEEVELFVTQS